MYTVILVDPTTNQCVYDLTHHATQLRIETAQCSFVTGADDVLMLRSGLSESRMLHVVIASATEKRIYRAEPPQFDGNHVVWTGLDPIVACDDVADYTALWSSVAYDDWQQTTLQDRSGRAEEGWNIEIGDMLRIGLKQGATYGSSNTGVGGVHMKIPSGSHRGMRAVQLEYEYALPSGNFQLGMLSYTTGENGAWGESVVIHSFAGNASTTPLFRRGIVVLPQPVPVLELFCYYNGASSGQNLAQDQTYYVKATDVRVVTSTQRMTNTTLASGTSIGATTMTVASGGTAQLYVGQRLYVGTPLAGTCEAVTVASVAGNVVSLTSGLVNTHSSGEIVRGLRISDEEIVADVVAQVRLLNPWALSADTFLIAPGTIDLYQCRYEQQSGLEVIRDMERYHGIPTTIDRDLLRVRYRQEAPSQTWVAEPKDVTIRSTWQDTVSRVRIAAPDASGHTLRGAYAIATTDEQISGYARTITYDFPTTTSASQTEIQSSILADRRHPQMQTDLQIAALYNRDGGRVPLHLIREGDHILVPAIANLDDLTTVPTITVGERSYIPETDELTIVPRTPLPLLERLLARTLVQTE